MISNQKAQSGEPEDDTKAIPGNAPNFSQTSPKEEISQKQQQDVANLFGNGAAKKTVQLNEIELEIQ